MVSIVNKASTNVQESCLDMVGKDREESKKSPSVGVIQGQTEDPCANKKGLWWQRDGRRGLEGGQGKGWEREYG